MVYFLIKLFEVNTYNNEKNILLLINITLLLITVSFNVCQKYNIFVLDNFFL